MLFLWEPWRKALRRPIQEAQGVLAFLDGPVLYKKNEPNNGNFMKDGAMQRRAMNFETSQVFGILRTSFASHILYISSSSLWRSRKQFKWTESIMAFIIPSPFYTSSWTVLIAVTYTDKQWLNKYVPYPCRMTKNTNMRMMCKLEDSLHVKVLLFSAVARFKYANMRIMAKIPKTCSPPIPIQNIFRAQSKSRGSSSEPIIAILISSSGSEL